MKTGKLVVRKNQCTLCGRCSLACSRRLAGFQDPARAAIRIIDNLPVSFDVKVKFCIQCPQASCMEACPSNALFRGEDGVVCLDREKCTGCSGLFPCVKACEAGLMFQHPEVPYPLKCDLCRGNPLCVKECLSEILTFKQGAIELEG